MPDERLCVLTSQRLALIETASARQVTSSVWLPNSAQRGFAIHGDIAYVPHRLGIGIIRIHDDRLERLPDIEFRYAAHRPPRVIDDRLMILRSRELLVYDLADPANPKSIEGIELPGVGGNIAVSESQLFAFTRERLNVYDRRSLTLLHEHESPVRIIGAVHVQDNQLYLFGDNTLHRLAISDPSTANFEQLGERISPVSLAIGRPDGFTAFRGFTRLHVNTEGDEPVMTALADDWPLESPNAAATGEALGTSELWTRLPIQAAAANGDHLVLFESQNAQVYNIADFANPRFVGRVAFQLLGDAFPHGNRVYTRNGALELSEPPQRIPIRSAVACTLDGDSLYLRHGSTLFAYDLRNEITETAQITLEPTPAVFTVHKGILYHVARTGELRSSQIAGNGLKPLGQFEFAGERSRPSRLSVDDDILYVNGYYSLRAIDVADPRNMRELGAAPQKSRHHSLIGRDRVGFAMRLGTGIVALDLETGDLIERGPVTNSRYLQIHREHVMAGLPVGGVGIYRSQTLDRLNAEAAARTAEADPLARAWLAAKQGSWQAEGLFRNLPDTPTNRAAWEEFTAQHAARQQARAAAQAFEEANRKQRFAYLRLDEDAPTLRILKPELVREHADHLRTLPIEKLDYISGPLGPADLAFIGKLTSLREVRLRELEAPAEAFAPLAALSELRYLDFHGSDLPPDALMHLAGLSKMDWLDLDSCAIRDTEVAAIANMRQLTFLSLEDCPVTEAALVHLRELRKLRVLHLGGTRLRQLAELANLTSLEILELQGVPATDGFEHLGKLTALGKLSLHRTAIRDEHLASFAALDNLITLTMSITEITDAGMPHLAKLSSLKYLVLNQTSVSNTGLEQLAHLPLQRLFVRGTQATEGAKRFFPDAEVHLEFDALRPTPVEQQEAERIQRLPDRLSFAIVENQLVIADAADGTVFARESPKDLFGDETVDLQCSVAWEQECWIGSNRGLLRYEPRSRVWSRFAIDREHLDVQVLGLEKQGDLLVVRYGEAQKSRFDLRKRQWLAPAVTEAASPAIVTPEPEQSMPWLPVAVLVILLGITGLLLKKAG